MERWNPDEKTYTCSECGQQKNDNESRYSFNKNEKVCWECQQVSNLHNEQIKILENINKGLNKIRKIQEDINKLLQPKKRD